MKYLIMLSTVLVLAGCASEQKPTLGDEISSKGAEYSRLAQDWNRGDALIEEGRALVAKGEKEIKSGKKMLNKGEDKVDDGEKMIKKGTALKKQAEEAYRQKTGA